MTEEEMQKYLNRFRPHAMGPEQHGRAGHLRLAMEELVATVLANTQPGREQSVALTKLEEASFFVIAAVAREGVDA